MIRVVLAASLLVTGCATTMSADPPAAPIASAASPNARYFGIAAPHEKDFLAINAQLGGKVVIDEVYMTIGGSLGNVLGLPPDVLPLVTLNPPLNPRSVAEGKYDHWLSRLASDLQRFPSAAVDYGHEFNGWWTEWAFQHETGAEFVAQYRRIHKIISGTYRHAIWVWRPYTLAASQEINLKDWYPGNAYVTWVGLSGYYNDSRPGYPPPRGVSTFSEVFGPTIQLIRAFASKPILIAETGASRTEPQASEVNNLITAAQSAAGIVGVVYFDIAGRRNWVLSADTLSALRTDLRAKQWKKP